jgi:hypothetical protein
MYLASTPMFRKRKSSVQCEKRRLIVIHLPPSLPIGVTLSLSLELSLSLRLDMPPNLRLGMSLHL